MNVFIMLLFGCALYLGVKINEKKQWLTFPISSWFPFENWFDLNDSMVSKNIEYFHLVDDVYTNGTNTCASIFNGIVLEVSDHSVHVLSDEGIQIIYGQLTHTTIQVDERILKGQSIGTFKDSLTLKISKDNQKMSYGEAMKF